MYLVPLHDPRSMYPDPTSWLVAALVDELETLAIECREAAASCGAATAGSRESVCSLDQAADTCVEITQLIRREYPARSQPRSVFGTTRGHLRILPDWPAGDQRQD